MVATEQGAMAEVPPDYWRDARRMSKEQLESFPALIRDVRKRLGLSTADVGKEVQEIVRAQNDIPGREQVVSNADWAGKGDAERCREELKSIRNGTRKYVVGYLAWLWRHDGAAAAKLTDEIELQYGNHRERPQKSTDQGDGEATNDHDAFLEASSKEQFYVYEAAFLWFEKAPPSMHTHASVMTPDIARMKDLLHRAIELGKLEALHFQAVSGGYVRLVQRKELQRFAHEVEIFPHFLFPDEKASPEDLSIKLAELEGLLKEQLRQLPRAIDDWAKEYDRNEWTISEAAFLWHGFIPPPAAVHERVMPDEVRRTKQMLHDAANAGALTPALDTGVKMRNVMVHGTRHVSRPELRQFAASIGQKPRFLFPEDEG